MLTTNTRTRQPSLRVERLEDRTVPSSVLVASPVAAAPTSGGGPITILNPATGEQSSIANPFPGFTGPLNVSVGHLNNDGVPDLLVAAGQGGGPHVIGINGSTGAIIKDFFAFDLAFRGGVSISLFDMTNDGIDEIVVGAGPGGGPHVKVVDGATNKYLREFFAFDSGFTGGVTVAAGNVHVLPTLFAPIQPAIVVGAGPGGGPNVRVFNANVLIPNATATLIDDFMAFDIAFRGGVNVAVGEVSPVTFGSEIIVGAGRGGGPHVKVFSVVTGPRLVSDFFAYERGFIGGVTVAADASPTLIPSIVSNIYTGPGEGGGPRLRSFTVDGQLAFEKFLSANDSDFGLNVG